MARLFLAMLAALFMASPTFALSTIEIKQVMINQSIRSYSGNCPCPYNRASNGSMCGRRSAWSRPGGASPLCYESDISDRMVEDYAYRNGLPRT